MNWCERICKAIDGSAVSILEVNNDLESVKMVQNFDCLVQNPLNEFKF